MRNCSAWVVDGAKRLRVADIFTKTYRNFGQKVKRAVVLTSALI
jgi:hypothetical protein